MIGSFKSCYVRISKGIMVAVCRLISQSCSKVGNRPCKVQLFVGLATYHLTSVISSGSAWRSALMPFPSKKWGLG
jgi:hypothetical protein